MVAREASGGPPFRSERSSRLRLAAVGSPLSPLRGARAGSWLQAARPSGILPSALLRGGDGSPLPEDESTDDDFGGLSPTPPTPPPMGTTEDVPSSPLASGSPLAPPQQRLNTPGGGEDADDSAGAASALRSLRSSPSASLRMSLRSVASLRSPRGLREASTSFTRCGCLAPTWRH